MKKRLQANKNLAVIRKDVETSRFTGKLDWIQIDLGEDDHGHMIVPDRNQRR